MASMTSQRSPHDLSCYNNNDDDDVIIIIIIIQQAFPFKKSRNLTLKLDEQKPRKQVAGIIWERKNKTKHRPKDRNSRNDEAEKSGKRKEGTE